MKYSDMTIEEAEIIQKHIQCEIIFDGDNKEVIFNNIVWRYFINSPPYHQRQKIKINFYTDCIPSL